MSETTNLKLFKHDNPSTNTNPFNVEQALNENWDKIDTAVGDLQDDVEENNTNIDTRLTELETDLGTAKTNITNIQAEQTTQNNNIEANSTAIETNAEAIEKNKEDITDLQAENANLKEQIPQGQASGEEISLQDSAEMELVDFGLEGNSRQETREGYNLIQASNEFRKGNAGSGITGSVTDEGYLQVVAEEGNANYINSFWSLNSQNSMAKVKEILKAGDTFTIAFTIKRTEGTSAAPRVYIKESTSYKGMTGTVTTEFKQVYYTGVWEEGNDISIIHLGFASLTGTFIIKDWLVKKGDLADWEDYGASPSLDYPSEVQAVGDNGNVEIVKSNKNILDFGNVDSSKIKYENSRITIKDPTTYLYNTICNILNNNFLYGKTLSFTFVANGKVTGDNYVNLVFYTNKRSYLIEKIYNKGTYSNSKFSKTITLEDEERFNQCLVYTAGTTCDLTIDVQVEIADEASEVIEHEGNTYPIPVQKPFLKGDYFIKEDNQWKEVHLREKRNIKDDIQNAVLSSTTNFIYFPNLLASTAFYKTNNDDVGVISNILRHTSYNNMNNASIDYGIGISDAGSLVIRIKEFTTLEEYKNALNNENYYYYYPLRNASKIECTGEQTQVLEQIIKDGTYKEVTHFYTTEDLKPTIELTYYKDLETLFNKQAELENTLNNVQAQILELGGN